MTSKPQLTVYFKSNPLWVIGSFWVEVVVDRWGEEVYDSALLAITTRKWETDLPPMNCKVRITNQGMRATSEWVDVSGGQTKVSLKLKAPAHDPMGYQFTEASVQQQTFSTGNIILGDAWST